MSKVVNNWKVSKVSKHIVGSNNRRQPIIATCFYDCDLPKKQAVKNAMLIAAAPDLLNACIDLVAILGQEGPDYYNKYIEELNNGIDAIKKATNG